jgi:acyl-CoA thioesterase
MTPQQIAEASATAMWAKDAACKALNFSLDAIGPGTATMSMVVQPHHVNGHGICHGGYIFTLADSAFAYACNSYNRSSVAQHNTISFIRPGQMGATLVAEAREVSLSGRSGLYDVTVHAAGKVIAEFRGASRIIDGVHFDADAQG